MSNFYQVDQNKSVINDRLSFFRKLQHKLLDLVEGRSEGTISRIITPNS